MSKAFTREDIDPPERSGRTRSASGLPPGAQNYITAGGAGRLREELEQLRVTNKDPARRSELEQVLASVTVVPRPEADGQVVTIGSRVTIEWSDQRRQTYTIVGVDEVGFVSDSVSWISRIGKALLSAELGDRVRLGDEQGLSGKVVKIEYCDQ